MHQQCVEVEVGDQSACPAQLDVAEGSGRRRTTAGKERVDQSAERTDGVNAGAAGFAGKIHLNGANLPHVDGEVEVAVDPSNRGAQFRIQRRRRHPGDLHLANLRQVNLARAIDAHVGAEIHLSPNPNAQLVARADDIVRGHGNHVQRRERRRNLPKQALSIDREQLTGGGGHEFLEFGQRLRRKRWLLLIPVCRLARQILVVCVVEIEGGLTTVLGGRIAWRQRNRVLILAGAL